MNRSRTLFLEPIEGTDRMLKGAVTYKDGSMNIFTGTRKARGFYLSLNTEKHADGMVSFVIGGADCGTNVLLAEAPRFNAKKLATLNPTPEQLADAKATVIAGYKARVANGRMTG